MQSVNVTELENNLAHYLRQVRQGLELTVKERNRIIARIVPPPPQDYDEELLELAQQGIVQLPEEPPDAAFVKEMLACELPRVKAKRKAARQLLQQLMDEERAGR